MRERAEIDVPGFISMEAYDDDITYRLVAAGTEVLGLPAEAILKAFGEYWISYTAEEGYGSLLSSFGDTLEEFLDQLNSLHSRAALTLTHLKPPQFRLEQEKDGGILLHYQSTRKGLAPMVVGLLHGLAKRFETTCEVEHLGPTDDAGEQLFRLRIASETPVAEAS